MEQIIIIPSLNPDEKLISLAEELIKTGNCRIIVVNDGSGAEHARIFQALGTYEKVTIIEHAVNLGKGAALKTAFAFCLEHFSGAPGVITADGDGQHTPEDILRIAEAMDKNPESIVLGVRAFSKSSTPIRSYIGNKTTNKVFNFLFHVDISDTQTGLRGIPAAELEWMLKIDGQRYDYELNILIQARRRAVRMIQIPIRIVYFDNNRGSHYRMFADSWLIAKIMLYNLFSKPVKKEPYYGALFYICRGIMRVFNKRFTITGEPAARPAVLVGHHQNLRGGIRVMMWLNINARPWMLGVFCDKTECYNQYYGYTFTKRYGWNKAFARIAAGIASWFIPKLAKSMRVVPVRRKSIKGLKKTIDESVGALCKNENILIFPDVDYASESNDVGEIYSGFISLDKFYYQKTGRHVGFVPLHVNARERLISFGAPSFVRDDEKYADAKKRVSEELRLALNAK